MTAQPTCEDRIAEHMAGRLEDFRAMLGRVDPEEPTDEEYEADGTGPLSEYPLGATVRYAIRVELSTGGPADWLDFIVDPDGEVYRASYHFSDWFDHAARDLSGDEFETAKQFLEALYGDLGDLGSFVSR